MYDCVLFDLDGTLINSSPGIFACLEYALQKMGAQPLPPEKKKEFIGPPLIDSFTKLCGFSREDALRAIDFYRERYSELGWRECSVYPGLANLMRSLHKNGARVCVASSKPDGFSRRIADHFGFARWLDVISAAPMDETVHVSKRELIQRALPGKPVRAAMVGDRRYDMEGARQAGVDAVGVLWGFGDRHELEQSGAQCLCADVDSLTEDLLEGAPRARGRFITFEGIDSCGKSTQLQNAARLLTEQGWVVRTTREPGGTPVGEAVRRLLLSPDTGAISPECEALLFAASRAQHVRDVILPALARGEIVLCDRFLDSSVAYQGGGRGLGAEAVLQANQLATQCLEPDLTLYYDISPELAKSRRTGGDDRIEREQLAFHKAVRDGYIALARNAPERITTLDGALDIDGLAAQTAKRIEPLLA